jgi:hypothetical protein
VPIAAADRVPALEETYEISEPESLFNDFQSSTMLFNDTGQ